MRVPWHFVGYLARANVFLKQGRLPALLFAVTRKRAREGRGLAAFKDDLGVLQELCIAWWRGSYSAVNPRTLLAVVAALVYFVTPLDAVADFIPGVGLLDDLAVLSWVLRRWSAELEAFRQWREVQDVKTREAISTLPAAERLD
jgi:uncharacterized membrane protein YkvA (DUF1232 family)